MGLYGLDPPHRRPGFDQYGTVIGTGRWFILRWQVSRVGWWVLASIVGWGSVGLAGIFGENVFLISIAGAGAVVGPITGVALVWLLRHPRLEIAT